jgi:hypothetical protein
MPSDPRSLEEELLRVTPADLDDQLLERLDACTEETWTMPTPDEIRMEEKLRAVAPAALSPALMSSLESLAGGVPFPQDDTIVRFPTPRTATAPRRQRGWWGAAAAVALTGAVTALLIPAGKVSQSISETTPREVRPDSAVRPGGKLIPATFNRGLSEASDQGVIWHSDEQPHRVLKFVYKDRATARDPEGHIYQIERPHVEYILVPAKTD